MTAATTVTPAPTTLRRSTVAYLTNFDTARFLDPLHTTDPPPPFPGYIREPVRAGPLPAAFPIQPRFRRWQGQSVIEFPNTAPAHYYATGEQAGPLLRNGTRKVLWNTDAFDYTDATPSLYQSHPFVLGMNRSAPCGKMKAAVPAAFGIICETTFRCTVDLRDHARGITIAVDGPMPAISIIIRETPQEVIAALAEMTGKIALPPRWALGYHQCRYSYEPASQVREVAAGFRARNIPCDTIWLDIDYMDGYRCFTFDPVKFPDPVGLVNDLHAQGYKVVSMIDPGIKVDEQYSVYAEGHAGDHFVKDVAGHEYHGEVWPGVCAFPDFTRERTRRWWAGLYAPLLKIGIDGFWNDMNEPAVFHVGSKTMPLDNAHDADADLGGPGDHARYHNTYGMQMTRASHDGLVAGRPDVRPFLLTRAAFLGSQRHAATWTGDNHANEDHFRWSIPMALNLGLCAQPFAGPDIGGFADNTDPELFARWMGVGALLPFARGHKNKGTRMHEPWELGADCEKACRLALQRRYRLLPYLYTLFEEASRTGLPVARPVFFADPCDARLRAVDDAFLLGTDVLVQTRASSPRPAGRWMPFELTDETHPALPTLLLREGALIPVGPIMQFCGEKTLDPLTLICNLDAEGKAAGGLYDDDGVSYACLQGAFARRMFHVERGADGVAAATVSSQEGAYPQAWKAISVVVLESAGA